MSTPATAATTTKANVTSTPTSTKAAMKTSNYIAIMAVASVLIVIGAGYVSKVLFGTLSLDRKIAQKKSIAANVLKTDVDSAKSLSTEFAALGPTGNKAILSALPTDADFPGLANDIEAMAGAAGVTYTDASATTALGAVVSDTTGGTTATSSSAGMVSPSTQNFTVAFSGGYTGLTRFLTNLESSARPITVNDISITGTNTNLTVSIDGTTYYQAPSNFSVTTEAVK